jgi:hypothetical protein
MSVAEAAPKSHDQLVRDLTDLIAALDRRVPHIDRHGEIEIAQDAAELRRKAQTRLDELTSPGGAR